jgi:hypothetical protein
LLLRLLLWLLLLLLLLCTALLLCLGLATMHVCTRFDAGCRCVPCF